MAFTPRTNGQILRELTSKVVARTDLNDVQVGSTLHILLQALATEIGNVEARMFNVRESFNLNTATGTDLDERVAELPPVGISRKNATKAAGAVLDIHISAQATDLLIPAGSRVSRSSDGTTYETAQDYIVPAGDDDITGVYVVCSVGGVVGNVDAGDIDTIATMPTEVVKVENTQPLTNGIDAESDDSLRDRALRYIRSLGRSQKEAIEFLGLNFIDSKGTSFKFAKVWEDPENLGYSELIVDDGSGLSNMAVPGVKYTDTVPPGGTDMLLHERPAVLPITTTQLTIQRNGVNLPIPVGAYKSIPERGVIFFKDPNFLQEGDVWTINDYQVYRGAIAELQREIEGNPNRASILTGFRAAGTRVKVEVPDVKYIGLSIGIYVATDANYPAVKTAVEKTTLKFINNLGIGVPLYPSQLASAIQDATPVRGVELYKQGTTEKLEIIYPGSNRRVLRARASNIITSNQSS